MYSIYETISLDHHFRHPFACNGALVLKTETDTFSGKPRAGMHRKWWELEQQYRGLRNVRFRMVLAFGRSFHSMRISLPFGIKH
jgi:hypothetical protein